MHVRKVWFWVPFIAISTIAQPVYASLCDGQPATIHRTATHVATHAATHAATRGPTANSDGREPKLVSLAVTNVPLKVVLTTISRQADVQIIFSGRVVPLERPISLTVKNVPAVEAVRKALTGTDVSVQVLENGNITLTRETSAQAAGQQGSGVVVGLVVDSVTKRHLARAQVSFVGSRTRRIVFTDAAGRFVFPDLPAGELTVSARMLGYTVQLQHVKVTVGDTATVVFQLTKSTVMLSEVVTTGAGERRKVEVGNAITVLDVPSILKTTPVTNVSDLLRGRVAGLDVLTTSGTVGAGSTIRIRGESSMLTSEDPVVVVDGVRYNNAYTRGPIPAGLNVNNGNAPSVNSASQLNVPASSRLDDIDPNSIETIEVLKGPAASALYGSDAANGVIVIKTKRGKAGPTRWGLTGQAGRSNMHASFNDNYFGWGTMFGVPMTTSCSLQASKMGQCVQDSVTHFNPLNHSATSPFEPGYTQRINGDLSGGSDKLQYSVNATYNNATGVLGFPSAIEAATVKQLHGNPLPSWADQPNVLNSFALSSQLTTQFNGFDLALSTNGIRQYHRDVPQGSSGFVAAAIGGPGYLDTLTGGWGNNSPANSFLTRTDEQVDHGYGALTGNWRPASRFTAHATVGIDYASTNDGSLLMQDYIITTQTLSEGSQSGRNQSSQTVLTKTADLNTTYNLPFGTRVELASTVGAQYTGTQTTTLTADGKGLPLGVSTLNSAASYQVTEYDGEQATAGWYLQEVLSLNQRFFLTGAIRGDASSSFGSQASTVGYPKWNASWLVSQEPFFPKLPGVNSLRVRVGYGYAGSQPPYDARFRTYGYTNGFANGSVFNTVTINTVGNPDLLPEKSVETEGGFDLGLLDDRVTLGMTFERKTTTNALVNTPLPPSFGANYSQLQNIGQVANHSFEIEATAHPIDFSSFNWTTSVSLSRNTNELVRLGTTFRPPVSSLTLGAVTQHYVEGYPLDGIWARPIVSYGDANHDGVIEYNELKLADSLTFAGRSAPAQTIGWQNTVGFFSGRVAVTGNFTYTGGQTQDNRLLSQQCNGQHCKGSVDPNSSIEQQVLAMASGVTEWPYLEQVSAFRFDALSLTLTASPAIARLLKVPNASVSLMGQNLKVWSKYRGADPEVNTRVTGDVVEDFGAIPQPRTWSLRVRLGF